MGGRGVRGGTYGDTGGSDGGSSSLRVNLARASTSLGREIGSGDEDAEEEEEGDVGVGYSLTGRGAAMQTCSIVRLDSGLFLVVVLGVVRVTDGEDV